MKWIHTYWRNFYPHKLWLLDHNKYTLRSVAWECFCLDLMRCDHHASESAPKVHKTNMSSVVRSTASVRWWVLVSGQAGCSSVWAEVVGDIWWTVTALLSLTKALSHATGKYGLNWISPWWGLLARHRRCGWSWGGGKFETVKALRVIHRWCQESHSSMCPKGQYRPHVPWRSWHLKRHWETLAQFTLVTYLMKSRHRGQLGDILRDPGCSRHSVLLSFTFWFFCSSVTP